MTDKSMNRRQFLKKSIGAAAVTTAFPAVLGQAASSFVIRVGLIGCGGRGSGALRDVLEAGKIAGVKVEVVALAEMFKDRLEQARERYRRSLGVEVPDSRCFVGFNAYKELISLPEVNYVMLATPPGFRPIHFAEAVKQGKHIFTEKPVAVDAWGARMMYAAADESVRKGLCVVAGTQRRHQKSYIETIKRIQDGAIGEIKALRAYWNGGAIWNRGWNPNVSDMENHLRNWYHFLWLCGDHIVEQHVHNLDVCNWIMGTHPIRAYGQGGRQALGPETPGHKWDHFAVEYEYPNGVRMFSQCRQISGCDNRVVEAVTGTKGESDPSRWIRTIDGHTWRFNERTISPYVQEHVDLITAIVTEKPINEARQVTDATVTAILGRESAYSGKILTWDDIMNSKQKLMPEKLEFGPLPKPVVPVPGKYKFI